MCGIAGILDGELANKEKIIGEMTSALIHRGPDDQGFYVDKFVGLGMRRLSIIDLNSGRQPITSFDEKLIIFFNGEIYNYKELREELLQKGIHFKTESDTEVILNMYIAYGEKMLVRLRGMFAFSIYNTETREIFIARDFFGIKPLYYLTYGDKIAAFSSEIKSFLFFPEFKPEVNDSAVYNYLSFQYNPLAETFFKNVYKLPPAHFMRINLETNETQIKKYWSFEFEINPKLSEKEAKKDIELVMRDSVKHHMIADVPVGAFLSGGIDSSIIATLMQQVRGDKKIKTYTVGFDTLTEAKESKETSDFLGSDHTEIKVTSDEYFKVLQKCVYHFDEPVADPSAIGLYFLAKEARKSVKVVLSGEGSDELFGGYNIYLEPYARAKLSWLPKSIINIFINLPFEFFGKNYLKRQSMRLEDWYIGNASIFKPDELKTIWKGAPQKILNIGSLFKQTAKQIEPVQMQYVDINTWLIGDILSKADKMTMANSLELRVPFLDKEVADLARELPDNFKWRGGVTKYLLREAFRKIIPESTRNRKKLGFPTPIRDWLTKDKQAYYLKILNNNYVRKNLNVNYIQEMIKDHVNKKADNSRKIYLLLLLALWYDTFIEK